MNLQTEANVYEPLKEFVKKVYVKPLEYKSTEVENDINFDVIGYYQLKQVNLQRCKSCLYK